MIIGAVAIVAESISLAFLFPLGTIERLVVSALHMGVGLILVLVVHVRSTFLAMMDDTEVSIMDCIACPPKAWAAMFRHLPETKKLVTTFVCSIVAMLCSLAILRAIPYSAVFTGPPPEEKPMRSVIVDQILANAGNAEEE